MTISTFFVSGIFIEPLSLTAVHFNRQVQLTPLVMVNYIFKRANNFTISKDKAYFDSVRRSIVKKIGFKSFDLC